MIFRIIISLLAISTFSGSVAAQVKIKPASMGVSSKESETLNKRDAKHRKQGMWWYEHPAKFGDPASYEFGNYFNDEKSGAWYKLDEAKQLSAIEQFKQGVLDGPAQYFEFGRLVAIGSYRGTFAKGKFDTFVVVNPETLLDTTVFIPAEKAFTKHGTWRYYDGASGHLILEKDFQVDIVIKERKFLISKPLDAKSLAPIKLPHEGGRERGWNIDKKKNRSSLIK